MAITRAQQAKQMLREGGRIGLFKGAQADTKQGKSMSPGTSAGGGSRFSGGDDRREQVSVARTQGKKTPTAQEVRNIVSEGPDDRGNVLQNRNQRNIVKYNQDLLDFVKTERGKGISDSDIIFNALDFTDNWFRTDPLMTEASLALKQEFKTITGQDADAVTSSQSKLDQLISNGLVTQ